MKNYYNQRAKEYEHVYQRPERQDDLQALTRHLQSKLADHQVLEVACGTGYWTRVVSKTAKSVLASDQSVETLEMAHLKYLPAAKVTFIRDDAFSLNNSNGKFTAGFAGFWWSHIPKTQIRHFLLSLHKKLPLGATVIFFDNAFKEGNSTPISRTDKDGNTYQVRTLNDGSSFEILKNFPTDIEFQEVLAGLAVDIQIVRYNYFWMLEYKIF